MDSLEDLLGRYKPQAPDEIALAKQYIARNFNTIASVAIKGETLIITVPSAALANTLRLRLLDLQDACNTSKRFIFRIG